MATSPSYFPILTKLVNQQRRRETNNGAAIVNIKNIKNIVIPLQVDYLEQAAKERGISRTKLVRIVMEKVVRDELISEIVSDDDLAAETPQPGYRRFRAL
jgi:hypothetical protein